MQTVACQAEVSALAPRNLYPINETEDCEVSEDTARPDRRQDVLGENAGGVALAPAGPGEEDRGVDERDQDALAAGGDDVDALDEGSGEAREPRECRRQCMPTLQEREEHRKTHLPFRSWCRECVAGRGQNLPHRRRDPKSALEQDVDVRMVHYDYCFMRDEVGGESDVILVSKDRRTRLLGAHHVPSKGSVHDWVIQQCCRDLEKWGYWNDVGLKSDQEKALVDVLKEIAIARGNRSTTIEHSPVGESQSNGLIERGVRSIEEMTRVLLLDLSDRVGHPISVSNPILSWVVEHAADLLNKYHVASDGKTAYERLKGREYKGETHAFGSRIMFRVCGKVHGGVMRQRWQSGIWLGQRFSSGEHIVAMLGSGKVYRARSSTHARAYHV